MTIFFSAVYKFAPAGKRKFIYQIPGAFFSAVAISVFSVYFAAYCSGSNVYNSFYGSLTSVTIFLIWIYSCVHLFLVGGVMNSHYQNKIEAVVLRFKERHFNFKKKRKEKRREKHKKNEEETRNSEDWTSESRVCFCCSYLVWDTVLM